jgi:hypothetical protein
MEPVGVWCQWSQRVIRNHWSLWVYGVIGAGGSKVSMEPENRDNVLYKHVVKKRT